MLRIVLDACCVAVADHSQHLSHRDVFVVDYIGYIQPGVNYSAYPFEQSISSLDHPIMAAVALVGTPAVPLICTVRLP